VYHWARELMGVPVVAVEIRPAPATMTSIPAPSGVVQAAMAGRADG
jgi:hypothetical protein